MIFTELWLERIKEIYITTYQSDTWTNSEQIKFRLLDKSNFNQSLAYTVFSLIKFIGINWREVYHLQKHFEEGNKSWRTGFKKDLSTGFRSWIFCSIWSVLRISHGWVQFVTWIHSWDTEFLSRKEQDDAQCVLQETKLVDQGKEEWGGSSRVSREHSEFVLCPLVGGSLSARPAVLHF